MNKKIRNIAKVLFLIVVVSFSFFINALENFNVDEYINTLNSEDFHYDVDANIRFKYKNGSSLAASVVLNKKVGEIFELLKRDFEIKKYLEKGYNLDSAGRIKTNEDIIKEKINSLLIDKSFGAQDKNEEILNITHISIPVEIFRKINRLFKENKEIRDIILKKNFSEDEMKAVKDSAISYIREYIDKKKKENELLENMSLEQKKEVLKQFKLEDDRIWSKKFYCLNFELYKFYFKKKVESLRAILPEISDESAKAKIEEDINFFEAQANMNEETQEFRFSRNEFFSSLNILKNGIKSEVTDEEVNNYCFKIKKEYEETRRLFEKKVEEIGKLEFRQLKEVFESFWFGTKEKEAEQFLQIGDLGVYLQIDWL